MPNIATFTRPAVVALILAGATAVGWAGASATGGGTTRANPPDPAMTAAAPQAPAQGPRAAVFGGETENYTGIRPCRVLDTRVNAPLSDAARTFQASGNLAAQGGANNCGIPDHATSLAINLTGISTGSSGFVRGWATGTAQPNATLLNFSEAINASNQVNIPLCRGGGCTSAFTLRTWGSAHLVGDVVGFYTAPAYAFVQPNASLITSSGVVAVAKEGIGNYRVTFDRDVDQCALTSDDALWFANRDASAEVLLPTPDQVRIVIRDVDDNAVDTSFYVAAIC